MRLLFYLLFLSSIAYTQTNLYYNHTPVKGRFYSVFPLEEGKKTVIKYEKQSSKKKKTDVVCFELLDEKLMKQKEAQIEHNKSVFPEELLYITKDAYYQLFYSAKTTEFTLFKIDFETLNISEITGSFGVKFDHYGFEVLGQHAYVSCALRKKSSKKKWRIMQVNVSTGNVTAFNPHLNFESKPKLEIYEPKMVHGSSGNELFFNYEAQFSKKNLKMCYYRFDSNGNQLNGLLLDPKPTKNVSILNTLFDKQADGSYLTYGAFAENPNENALGLFIANTSENTTNWMKFHQFSEIKNYKEVVNWNKEISIKESPDNDDIDGIGNYFNSRVIIKDGEQYYCILEYYYKTYWLKSYNTYDAGGSQVTRQRWVFDGNQHTHAVVLCIDLQGNKKWSNSIKMRIEGKLKRKRHFIKTKIENQTIELSYNSGGQFHNYKINKENGNVLDQNVVNHISSEQNKKSRVIQHWFGKTYLQSGNSLIDPSKKTKMKNRRFSVKAISKE